MTPLDDSARAAGHNPARKFLLIALALIAVQALILLAMGRVPICTCGYVKLWHGAVDSENSQHIFDLYSFTHVIHGFLLYFLLSLVGRRTPVALRLMLAVLIEGSWELIENSEFVISRYRGVTISQTYFGDSVINSVFDTVSMTAGFVLASRLAVWSIVLLAAIFEAGLAYFIRDNLALNIIMLIHPFEGIKAWQSAVPLH
jgi:general stress protein CsbA